MNVKGPAAYSNTWIVKDSVWELKFVREAGGLSDKGNSGLCDPSIKTIYIKQKLSKWETFLTFCHEIAHSIFDEYSYEEQLDKIFKKNKVKLTPQIAEAISEMIAETMEIGVPMFIMENARALGNIFDEKKKLR